MSKTYEFLAQCGTFFVSTIQNGQPQTRPFGAVMEYEGEIYISTANTKSVYSQLLQDPAIQVVGLKPGSRRWVRISGRAVEVKDLARKQNMLDACPVLNKRFGSKECEYFALFKIVDMQSFLMTDAGAAPL